MTTFIQLAETCSIKLSAIVAVMVVPDKPTILKVEYLPNNITSINHATPEDAKENYKKLMELILNVKE